MGSRLLWLVLAGLLLRAQTVPPSATNPDAEKQAALEARLAAEAQRRTTAISDPEIFRYVKQIGARLATVMPPPSHHYEFVVIAENLNGSTHEPFSLPGGTIFVPLRLLADAQDEAEFAGMLAHAMSHVALYEPERQNPLVQGVPLYTGINMSLGGSYPGAVPLSLAQTMRARERSADFLAVQVMAKAGYP
ncbi:MAG TPA: M48 family metalloprotease, partial [Bryobacteraceae bacterium]|nr:M48 family metalloprotease [Bryobacteraceae bacterium]